MKKLGNGKGRRIHPAPPPGTAPRDHLAAIPAAVLALVAALTAGEQEVLAYLLSGGGGHERGSERRLRPHPPELGCECFCCYKSFWARWDASPNRHLIHRIIDAVEESLESRERERGGGGRRRKRNGRRGRKIADSAAVAAEEEEDDSSRVDPKGFLASEGEPSGDDGDVGSVADDDKEGDVDDDDEEEGTNGVSNPNGSGGKSSVRRFMSFIGARVWGVWN